MTGDELERAIQFLLEGQAKNDALIGQIGVRVDQLTADVNRLTGDVTRLTGDFADFKVLVREFAERPGFLQSGLTRAWSGWSRTQSGVTSTSNGWTKLWPNLRRR